MRQIKNTLTIIMVVMMAVANMFAQTCTLTPPANVTLSNTVGTCGANVTLANATGSTACTSFTEVTLSNEEFTSCAQGAWTTSIIGAGGATGVTACGAALFSFGCTANTNFTGTSPAAAGLVGCRAHINDDDAGSAFVGTGILTSPVVGVAPVGGKLYELQFGYEYVDLGNAQFSVEVGSGATWTQKFITTVSANGILKLDITAQMAATMQVRFLHADGGAWAWGVGIDNVKIVEKTPIAAIITNSFNGTTNPSGMYPVGITTVTYTVQGSSPAITTTSTVTINDTEAPTLVCPPNTTYSLKPGECAQLITYNVTGTDNCPFIGPLTTLNTITSGGNGNAVGGMVFFDISNNTTGNLIIKGFNMNITAATMVDVYIKSGTYVGATTNAAAWTLAGQANAMTGPFSGAFPGNGTLTVANIVAAAGITLPAGVTGIALRTLTAASNYTNGTGANQAYSDANISLSLGATNNGLFIAGFTPRVFNGGVRYQIGTTAAPVMQTAGLPSGAEFPIGTTTNTFKLTDVAGNMGTCSFAFTVQEYPFAITALACQDMVNISLGEDCQVDVNASMILSGGPYGCYDDYIVTVTGGGSVITKPGLYTVTVLDPETGNSCWGKIVAEDKLPPVITCGDFTVKCIDPIPAVPIPPFNGNKLILVTEPIPFEGGAANKVTRTVTIPEYVTCKVTDLNVLVNVTDDWMGDLIVDVKSPTGTTVNLWNGFCGLTPPGLFYVADDEGVNSNLCVDYQSGNAHFLPGLVPLPPLSAFDGQDMKGTWTVEVTDAVDDAGVDGIVNALELRFSGCTAPGFFPKGSCGEDFVWTFSDNVKDNGCDGEVITRTWTAKDASNNTTNCIQKITVENITLAEVILPPSLVVMNSCGAGITPADVAAYFDIDSRTGSGIGGYNDDWTEVSGSPAGVVELNEGYAIGYPHYFAVGRDGNLHAQKIDNNVCSIYATYTDQVLSACGAGCIGNSKVIRTWTLLDWCTIEQATYVQVIKAVDLKAPTFIVKDVTVGVSPWGCVANFDVPAPWELADNCDAHPKWWIEGPAGVVITGNPIDGYKVTGAPKGVHNFTYKAIDCCGNIGTAVAVFTVIDRAAPVAVAKQNIVMSLTGSGTGSDGAAKLFTGSVDNGSYDFCSDIKLELRRPDGSPDCGNLGIEDHNNNVTFDDDENFSPGASWKHPEDDKDDTDDGKFVKFCCVDLAGGESTVHQVIMRVWDDGNMNGIIGDNLIINGMQDNYNETWVDVRVENKLAPVIVCPKDATVTCDMELNISTVWRDVTEVVLVTGEAEAFDLCNGIKVEYKDTPTWTNTCENVGRIRREFRAIKGTKTVNCFQTITVGAIQSTFVVTPPSNSVLDAPCDFDKSKIKASDKPKVLSGACDVIGEEITIDEYLFEDGVCKKWRVNYNYINWCTGEQKGPFVKYYKYKDEVKPVLTCADQMFAANPNPQNPLGGCEGTVNLEASATDEGGCIAGGWLKWTVIVDLWGNGTNDYEFSSFLPTTDNNLGNDTNGNGIPDRYVAPTSDGQLVKVPAFVLDAEMSTHKVFWKVTDGCGNVTSCNSTFMVVDKKAPTPYCVSLSSALMQNGQVELWAIDFNKGSFDNCTAQNDLLYTFDGEMPVWLKLGVEHYFKGAGLDATAAEYNAGNAQRWVPSYRSSARIFNTVGVIDVNMSVWDGKGNTDFCKVTLTLIDNNAGSISGNLTTVASAPINKVNVRVNANVAEFPQFGTFDGKYYFATKDAADYTVEPTKADDYTNGVSTLDLVLIQRHILGIAKLNSPEKLIAADINKDGKVTASDLVELRKLILGMNARLSNNDSWTFVPKSYVYPDATNPYSAPRTITLNVADHTKNIDFTGIKIGDVNLDAVAATGVSSDNRTSNSLKLEAEDKEVKAGEVVTLDVTAANFAEIFGYQFTAKLSGAELLEVKSGAINVEESYGMPTSNTMTMSYASDKAVNVNASEVLFTIVLKAKENGRISNMIAVGSDVTRSESYVGAEMTTNKLEMNFRTNGEVSEGYALYQNEPNPFKATTVVSFNMPSSAKTTITLTDVTGKVVNVKHIDAVKGMNKVEYNRNDVPVSGVVYYTVSSGEFTATKAMIIIE